LFLNRNTSLRQAYADKVEAIATEMFNLVVELRSDGPLSTDKEQLLQKFCEVHNVVCELMHATQFLSTFMGDEEDQGRLVVGIIVDDDDTEMPGV
jgi:hypothetical protein